MIPRVLFLRWQASDLHLGALHALIDTLVVGYSFLLRFSRQSTILDWPLGRWDILENTSLVISNDNREGISMKK
ncbi:hypothetical protein, partial [Novosphingobium umbonatum]|uniref:hypothetical protein n=1 Tax=Novosphingobium umbonatum TaxID=1908524 RepID=UPI001C708639